MILYRLQLEVPIQISGRGLREGSLFFEKSWPSEDEVWQEVRIQKIQIRTATNCQGYLKSVSMKLKIC